MNIRKLVLALLSCFGACFMFAQSQPPTPSPGQTSKSQQDKAYTEIDKKDSDNQPTITADEFLGPPTPEPARRGQPHSAYEGIKKTVYRWGQVTSAIVVAFFTAILTVVAILQWRTYHRQADIMAKGLTATEEAAKAATLSANLAKTALQLTERADVAVDKMCMEDMHPISIDRKSVV